MKFLVFALILGLFGCTYETEDEDMSLKNKKAWSASGSLIAGAGASGNGISLAADFVEEPGNYTVQFGLTQPPIDTLQAGDLIKAVAEIIWSVEGNDVRRRVNCVNGMSVTGTGQGVKVIVRDTSVVANPISYPISMQVVKGTRPSVSQPPYLEDDGVFSVNPTDQVNIGIPQNAGATSVYLSIGKVTSSATPILPNTVLVQHLTEAGTILKSYDPFYFQWVPISPSAVSINVFSEHSEQLYVSPVWGIDG